VTATLQFLPSLWKGLIVTAQMAVLSILGCALLSLALGVPRASKRKPPRVASAVAIEFFRGASALVFLFWAYYALPLVPGMPQLGPMVASVAVLSLVGGAYGAEIVRAGLQAVPPGQYDASRALSLRPWQALRKVILPQALSQIVPAFGSLAVDLVKWTSLVSFVGVQDVLYVANSIRSITFETVPVFLVLAGMYWVLCLVVGLLFQALERTLPLNRALTATRRARAGGLA